MKVRCLTHQEASKDLLLKRVLDRHNWPKYLTPNKLYDVIEIGSSYSKDFTHHTFSIKADDGDIHLITQKMFETLRNINLDKLLQSV